MAEKYIVVALSYHSDRMQQKFKAGDIIKAGVLNAEEITNAVNKKFIREYTPEDEEADALKRSGVKLKDLTFPTQLQGDALKSETTGTGNPVTDDDGDKPPVGEDPQKHTGDKGKPVKGEELTVQPLDISLSVPKLSTAISECTDVAVLEATLAAEQATEKPRTTAVEAINKRIEELKAGA